MQGGFFNQLFQWYASLHFEQIYEKVVFSKLLLDLKLPNITKRNFSLQEIIKDEKLENNFTSICLIPLLRFRKLSIHDTVTNMRGSERIAIGFFQYHSLIEKFWSQSFVQIQNSHMLKKAIENDQGDYISMHVRLSDYLENSKTRKFHGLSTPSYYLEAVQFLYDSSNVRKVRLVTDSPKKIQKFMYLLKEKKINVEVIAQNFEVDFLTLTSGQSIIMSNSSFSWWAAYIGNKIRKANIITPYPWFSDEEKEPIDLIPKHWYKIRREIY